MPTGQPRGFSGPQLRVTAENSRESAPVAKLGLTMMTSTTGDIAGFKTVRNFGVVDVMTVSAVGAAGNLMGGMQALTGGKLSAYSDLTETTRKEASDQGRPSGRPFPLLAAGPCTAAVGDPGTGCDPWTARTRPRASHQSEQTQRAQCPDHCRKDFPHCRPHRTLLPWPVCGVVALLHLRVRLFGHLAAAPHDTRRHRGGGFPLMAGVLRPLRDDDVGLSVSMTRR